MSTGCGIGLSRGGRAPRWLPSKLGSSARFIARADHATVVSGNVTSLANAGGTAGAMTSSAGGYCTLDTAELLNGNAAIRTSSTSSKLRVLTGGPSGSGPCHLVCVGRMMSQPGAGQENSTFMLSGPPGNGGGVANLGIGVTAASNGAWTLVGGFGNNVAQGPALTRATFDNDIHVFELISDGTQIIMLRDGGLLGTFANAATLSTGEMGFQGWYPLASYGPSDTRIWWAGWFDRELTSSERRLLFAYLKRQFALAPKRFFSATGDSITAGNVGGANTTSFLIQLQAQYLALGTPETVYIDNHGVSSETTTLIAGRSPSTFVRDYSPPGYRTQYLIINGGKTDNQATETPAQAYANLASISLAAQALGVTTAMSTAFYGTAASMTPSAYAWVDALNALIRANACGADYVIDYYVDPLLATPTVTHFHDNIHPDNVALAAMAAVDRAVLG